MKILTSQPKTWKAKVMISREAKGSHRTSIGGAYWCFNDAWDYHEEAIKRRKFASKIFHHVKDDKDIEENISLIIKQFWNFLRKK
jgi:hypothetical protein